MMWLDQAVTKDCSTPFVQYCAQNKLIIDYPSVYPYKAIIWLKFTVSLQPSICKSEVWMIQVFYPYNHTIQTILLWVLFIGQVLLSSICLGSVHGTTAGDCHARYLGSCISLFPLSGTCRFLINDPSFSLQVQRRNTMRYSVLSLNLIAQRYKKKKDSFLLCHSDGPHNQVQLWCTALSFSAVSAVHFLHALPRGPILIMVNNQYLFGSYCVVLLKSGSEPKFKPEPLGPNSKFSSRFRIFAELNLRSSSRFSQS